MIKSSCHKSIENVLLSILIADFYWLTENYS